MSAAFDVATKLVALGYGTLGSNLGVNAFIDSGDNEIAVFEYPGTPDLTTHSGVAFEYPNVQVQVRHTIAQTAFQKCYDIYAALRDLKDQTINAHIYQYFEPKMLPTKLDIDEQLRTTWMCELKLHRTPEA